MAAQSRVPATSFMYELSYPADDAARLTVYQYRRRPQSRRRLAFGRWA